MFVAGRFQSFQGLQSASHCWIAASSRWKEVLYCLWLVIPSLLLMSSIAKGDDERERIQEREIERGREKK
jgi:hypothetical protein